MKVKQREVNSMSYKSKIRKAIDDITGIEFKYYVVDVYNDGSYHCNFMDTVKKEDEHIACEIVECIHGITITSTNRLV